MKIKEVIQKLEAHHAPLDPERRTCDGVIAGDPERECTGIVTTCCPTAAVVKEAARLGYNFIICHEPTFFDGWDETDWLEENGVYKAKMALIQETGVTIYRDHDHLHNDQPDGIFTGLVKKLGWEEYQVGEGFAPASLYEFPETTVGRLAADLARAAQIDGMRILGDPEMKVTRAGITFHFLGGPMDRVCIDYIDKNDCQVVIPGEVIDWTIGEYVQDAIALGKKRALLNPGHFNWEEPGMEYMAQWLPGVVGPDVPMKFVQSGNSYQWLDFKNC